MNFNGQVPYQLWLKLPLEVRDKLVVLFHIPRSGSTVVDYGPQGNTVVSDGYKPTDIEAITLEKMQAILQTEDTNFFGLFEQIATNIDLYIDKPVKLYDDDIHGGWTEAVKDLPIDNTEKVVNLPFCDQCDSKGGRHKKVCPKYK